MSRKDISNEQVVKACNEFHYTNDCKLFVDEILMRDTGQPLKVCEAALERAEKQGLIEYGVSIRTAWAIIK